MNKSASVNYESVEGMNKYKQESNFPRAKYCKKVFLCYKRKFSFYKHQAFLLLVYVTYKLCKEL